MEPASNRLFRHPAHLVSGVTAIVREIDAQLPSDSTRSDEDIATAAANALHWNLSVPTVTYSSGRTFE